ncbi:MAG: alpha/beta hydrolase [Sporichthyaceae bacterium]
MKARPQYDPELRAGLAVVGGWFPPTITPDMTEHMRAVYASDPQIDSVLAARGIARTDFLIPGHRGQAIEVSVLRHERSSGPRPAVLFLHSGGMMFGDRFSAIELALAWVDQLGAVLVTVEYRLAPEFGDPYPREDCYAALEWIGKASSELGIRPERILVAGGSAGGGLAAGLALATRDRGGPSLCAQLLDYPMLDDRGITASTRQFDGMGIWDRTSNETGWAALLGAACGGPEVSPYAAPARALDLAGLPPAFIDVGAVEIFRDEAIDFARGLWAAGGDAELHIWSGAFHACDIFAPHTAVSREMMRTRDAWVARMLDD